MYVGNRKFFYFFYSTIAYFVRRMYSMEKTKLVEKLQGYEFWDKVLKRSKYVVAPMVDQSELAWRMLSRKHGAELCYSPMYHASVFARNSHYRKEALASCEGDRPLIIQFCANDPDILIQSALLAQDVCDAIDINLGCPQTIAKRGYYGAFLSDNWELVAKLVKVCHEQLSVPVTCKIRIFSDIEKTVGYAKMLESAGCQLLTVHGRTKEMKGPLTGIASWEHIKAIKAAVTIPVFANGNIQYKADVERCLQETKVDGVMIAEGSLHNPGLFQGATLVVWDIALEYLDFADEFPCPVSYMRGHVFKLCHHALQRHTRAREVVSNARNISDIRHGVTMLKEICTGECGGKDSGTPNLESSLPFPHWICQPYVRPPPNKSLSKKKNTEAPSDGAISKKKLKKLLKRGLKIEEISGLDPSEKAEKIAKFVLANQTAKPVYAECVKCGNPSSRKCIFLCCKPCCRKRTKEVNMECSSHKNGKKFNKPVPATNALNTEEDKGTCL